MVLSDDHILTTGGRWLGWWGSWKELVSGAGTSQTPRLSLSHTSIRLCHLSGKLGSLLTFRPSFFSAGIGDLDPSPRSDQISRLSQGSQCAPLISNVAIYRMRTLASPI